MQLQIVFSFWLHNPLIYFMKFPLIFARFHIAKKAIGLPYKKILHSSPYRISANKNRQQPNVVFWYGKWFKELRSTHSNKESFVCPPTFRKNLYTVRHACKWRIRQFFKMKPFVFPARLRPRPRLWRWLGLWLWLWRWLWFPAPSPFLFPFS